ncbi:Uncharacterized protein PBTT_04928 [Plasmodiophora brassicae]
MSFADKAAPAADDHKGADACAMEIDSGDGASPGNVSARGRVKRHMTSTVQARPTSSASPRKRLARTRSKSVADLASTPHAGARPTTKYLARTRSKSVPSLPDSAVLTGTVPLRPSSAGADRRPDALRTYRLMRKKAFVQSFFDLIDRLREEM